MGAGALGRWLVCWLGLLLAAAPVRAECAQGTTDAVLRGQVHDGRGSAVGGAAVRLVSVETGVAWVAGTDRGGSFGFLSLPAGEYMVSLRLAMTPVWAGSVRLRVEPGEVADVDLRWSDGPGGVLLEAEGSGAETAVAPVETAEGPVGAGASRRASSGTQRHDSVMEMPVPGREWEAMAEISSAARDTTLADGGAAQDPGEGEETASVREGHETGSAASGLSFGGVPSVENTESVDGLAADQGFRSGPRDRVGADRRRARGLRRELSGGCG